MILAKIVVYTDIADISIQASKIVVYTDISIQDGGVC